MNTDIIRGVRRVITHKDCADGIMSALICCDALNLPAEAVTFLQYNTPEHRELQPEPGVLFVDMTPWYPKGTDGQPTASGMVRLQRWVDEGAIVLDHHEGARDVVADFGERGIFGDNAAGDSGAWLAYLVLSQHAPIVGAGRLAGLIAIRDTWQRESGDFDHASEASAAMKFCGFEALRAELDKPARGFPAWQRVEALIKGIGPVLRANDQRRAQACLAEAHFLEVEGLRVVAFEGLGPDSSNVSDLGPTHLGQRADLIVAWHVFAEGGRTRMVCSLRSRTDLALRLALHHGGGGHPNAAGLTVDLDPHDGSPPAQIARLVRFWKFAQEGT